MASKIIMPKLGLTMTEGTVERWCKNEGDAVSAGDTIAEVATDKLTNEIQAECDGVLIKIVAHEGDSVPVKGIIGYIGAQGETVDDASVTTESKKEADAPAKSNEDDNSVLVIGSRTRRICCGDQSCSAWSKRNPYREGRNRRNMP